MLIFSNAVSRALKFSNPSFLSVFRSYRFSKIEIDTLDEGSLTIELQEDKSVLEAILESVYEVIDTSDFIATLDSDQLREIAEYYKELTNV